MSMKKGQLFRTHFHSGKKQTHISNLLSKPFGIMNDFLKIIAPLHSLWGECQLFQNHPGSHNCLTTSFTDTEELTFHTLSLLGRRLIQWKIKWKAQQCKMGTNNLLVKDMVKYSTGFFLIYLQRQMPHFGRNDTSKYCEFFNRISEEKRVNVLFSHSH